MFHYLPRGLRDIIFQTISLDPVDTIDEPISYICGYMIDLREAQEGSLQTPLDHRFKFLERHNLQPSYTGSSFVREMVDTYFRFIPFKIDQVELCSCRGHQNFFLSDKYGLGFPLGQSLSRVEVKIATGPARNRNLRLDSARQQHITRQPKPTGLQIPIQLKDNPGKSTSIHPSQPTS